MGRLEIQKRRPFEDVGRETGTMHAQSKEDLKTPEAIRGKEGLPHGAFRRNVALLTP